MATIVFVTATSVFSAIVVYKEMATVVTVLIRVVTEVVVITIVTLQLLKLKHRGAFFSVLGIEIDEMKLPINAFGTA